MKLLYLPFLMQFILMSIDELIHLKRGLPLWEKLGHPLDTLTVFIPLALMGSVDQKTYWALGIFSCIFITKDEWVHSRECQGFEHWLHSLLFIIHPVIFYAFYSLGEESDPLIGYFPYAVFGFMAYQILRWSIPWKILQK